MNKYHICLKLFKLNEDLVNVHKKEDVLANDELVSLFVALRNYTKKYYPDIEQIMRYK